jgi:pyruvate kinase
MDAWPIEDLRQLLDALSGIRTELSALERRFAAEIEKMPESQRLSARNLVHYLALRRKDLRPLQDRLAAHGLSSLGRSEANVWRNLDAVIRALSCMAGIRLELDDAHHSEHAFKPGRQFLEQNTSALLGPPTPGRSVRIMVTMPSDAASDYALVRELLRSGMNCMRVNGAHDDEAAWTQMIENLRRAERDVGLACTVLIDVPGPKLRTGPTRLVGGVIRASPKRDRFGRTVEPCKIWLTPTESPESAPLSMGATLSLSEAWLRELLPADKIKFFDASGQPRSMKITEARGRSRVAETDQTAYLTSDTTLQRFRRGEAKSQCRIATIPPILEPIILRPGDLIDLYPMRTVGSTGPRVDADPSSGRPAIGVTLAEIFSDAKCGESIWFDDGKIGGVIRATSDDRITVEITKARPKGEKLRADKGINLPDTDLRLPALTENDRALLPFLTRHADLLGYSFVRRPQDIELLQNELSKIGGRDLGIILKIETRKAFENLPRLILTALRSSRIGIMIARGDLAVECGFERTGELQEEIMWIAEAAHVPVVWATQVLERLAKRGQPSRAEISDAAMSERAECVMLNKGPYIVEAVKVLDDVLRRMQRHQIKKVPLMRPLAIATNFGA